MLAVSPRGERRELVDVHRARLARVLARLAYLIVAGSLVAFTAYMWLLRNAPTSLVATYAYVNPVVAVLLGLLVLGEPLGWRTIVGGGMILGAVALIVRAPKPDAGARRSSPGRLPSPHAAANLDRMTDVRPAQRAGFGRARSTARRSRSRSRRVELGGERYIAVPEKRPRRARGHARLDRLGLRAAPVRAAARALHALPRRRRPRGDAARCASTRRRARTPTS